MAPVRVAYDTIIPFDRLGRSRVYCFGRQSKGGQAWNGDPHARVVLHIAKPVEQPRFCQKCSKSDLAVEDIERAASYQVRNTFELSQIQVGRCKVQMSILICLSLWLRRRQWPS